MFRLKINTIFYKKFTPRTANCAIKIAWVIVWFLKICYAYEERKVTIYFEYRMTNKLEESKATRHIYKFHWLPKAVEEIQIHFKRFYVKRR